MKKDKKKLIISVLAGILALVMVLGLISAVIPILANAAEKSSSQIQSEIDELEKEKKEIQAQIKELQGQLSDNMEDMEAVVAQKNVIDQEIFLLYEQMANINAQITAYGSLIADKQAELDKAQTRLEELQKQNKARIRAMEKNSTSSYWSVIFKADSFLDMLDRLDTIYKINEADRKLIQELDEAAAQVSSAKEELETEKAELEQTKAELEEAEKTLEEKRAQADSLLAELVAKGEEYEALVEEAEQSAAELDSEIGDLEDAYDAAKDREYREWLASQPKVDPPNTSNSTGGTAGSGTVTDGITWLIPCNYTKLSSPYGWRLHPVYNDYRFHFGVDLSAASGTPIVATRSGTVTTAKYSTSGGYYVQIDHGDGFASRYLHMTHYIVSVGQTVSAGQVIGYVGSTGISTGPHLHFSLYYNGSSVNPADYLDL